MRPRASFLVRDVGCRDAGDLREMQDSAGHRRVYFTKLDAIMRAPGISSFNDYKTVRGVESEWRVVYV